MKIEFLIGSCMDKKIKALKYLDVPLKFSHYYKYVFQFEGKHEDGTEIILQQGGTSEDIYRFEVTATEQKHIRDLDLKNYDVYEEAGSIVVSEIV